MWSLLVFIPFIPGCHPDRISFITNHLCCFNLTVGWSHFPIVNSLLTTFILITYTSSLELYKQSSYYLVSFIAWLFLLCWFSLQLILFCQLFVLSLFLSYLLILYCSLFCFFDQLFLTWHVDWSLLLTTILLFVWSLSFLLLWFSTMMHLFFISLFIPCSFSFTYFKVFSFICSCGSYWSY